MKKTNQSDNGQMDNPAQSNNTREDYSAQSDNIKTDYTAPQMDERDTVPYNDNIQESNSNSTQTRINDGGRVIDSSSGSHKFQGRNKGVSRQRGIRLAVGSIPYMLFLVALCLISIGFFRYVEQESPVAAFLTQRDAKGTTNDWSGKTWTSEIDTETPLLDGSMKAVERENGNLLVPFFYIGDQIGTVNFPSIDLAVKVFEGDSEAQFRLGAGHSISTFLPGQNNNTVIGAHRTNHFRKLEYVKAGETVVFKALYGNFTYHIDDIRIIKSGDNSVAKPTSKEQLTIYTCYPFVYFGNAPNRYVLICSLVESEIFK